ncbi:MORN repeat-containing protein [Marivirga harenae]|uniref:MORN repeat-containing protein n=1 Tax=Marivirga harenae TaxID=2010992 RepID=UPI0026E0F4BB|nr:hypothetical protein [Marivirga harenae]WKV12118.1 hypothetical protein Q3Y49_18130 [Marivirga harenae]
MEKVKKIALIALPIIIIGCLVAIFFISKRKNHFQRQTQAKEEQLENLQKQNELYRQKSMADELFIAGEYQEALQIYLQIEDSIQDNSFMKSRKATIAKFNSLRSELDSTQNMSSSQLVSMEREMDKRVSEVEKEYEEKIANLKSKYNQEVKSLNVTIDQKERQIQNKAELGRLTFYNANGTKIAYFGEMKFGKANGEGVGHYSSNSVYDGDWKNNMKHGKGTYKWVDGHKYVGEYLNDKREGEGTYFWNTGEKYQGDWKNDKRYGQGTLYDKDGNVKLEGEWKNDQFVQ